MYIFAESIVKYTVNKHVYEGMKHHNKRVNIFMLFLFVRPLGELNVDYILTPQLIRYAMLGT
jgi:hypothetical protein